MTYMFSGRLDATVLAHVLAVCAMTFIAMIVLGLGRPAGTARTVFASETYVPTHERAQQAVDVRSRADRP